MGKPNVKKMEAKKDVEGLIKVLKDKERMGINGWYVRRDAAAALVKIGEPAVEPLIQALKDEDDTARELAAAALANIGDTRAVEPLIQALKTDKNKEVREDVKKALEKLKAEES